MFMNFIAGRTYHQCVAHHNVALVNYLTLTITQKRNEALRVFLFLRVQHTKENVKQTAKMCT